MGKFFQASTVIHAPRETIWKILTDGAAYPAFHPDTIRIEGTIAAGQKITAYSKLSPERAFPVTVRDFVPGERMTWVGGMPLGMFTGVRSFTLMPKGSGVEFTLREEFSGWLLGAFAGSLPDMTASFESFAAGLKARAEHGA